MPKKTKIVLDDVCPACGGIQTSLCEWSGAVPGEPKGYYQGPWISCDQCGLQGPQKVWDRMARRNTLIAGVLTAQHKRYQAMIVNFSRKMLRELVVNDSIKGDFTTWKPDRPDATEELENHVVKLISAINKRQGRGPAQVSEFCADIANTAMAIDKHLGLKQ